MNKENIKLTAWFKNNAEWYYPTKTASLWDWDNYEILNYYNDKNFLVYAWNKEDKANSGRLYRAELK